MVLRAITRRKAAIYIENICYFNITYVFEMTFSNIIECLYADRVCIRTYGLLALRPDGMTGRELGRFAGVSPFKMHKILRHLVAQRILRERSVGRSHLYTLNRDQILVRDLVLPNIQYAANLFSEMGRAIMERSTPTPIAVILYGSVARGDEICESDIDLLCVYSSAVDLSSLRMVDGDPLIAWMGAAYGNPVSIRRMTMAEIQQNIAARDAFMRNVIKEGKSIAGLTIVEVLNYGRT